MDNEFFERSIDLFIKLNPNAKDDLNLLMHSVTLFTDEDVMPIIDAIYSSGFLCQYVDWKKLSEYSESKMSIVVKRSKTENCLQLKRNKNGQITIIIKFNNSQKIEKAFEILKKNPIIKSNQLVAPF